METVETRQVCRACNKVIRHPARLFTKDCHGTKIKAVCSECYTKVIEQTKQPETDVVGVNPIDMVHTLASNGYITESRMYKYLQDMRTLKNNDPLMYQSVSAIVEGAYRLGLNPKN